jgi:DnaA family protein
LTVRDDVQSLDAPAQAELFTRINEAREGRGAVLAAGDAPPAALGLREDLRTRLAWGLVYQLQPLTDAEKEAFLREEAGRRGLRMPDEVVRYVLTHLPRDLVSLHKAIERIDRHSLARHRQVTLALAREALADPRTR